ncbi:tRNA uridine(34) 5-carboxymethylaminomethyl modification radical SAM/GNAT enzyme Elp3, partial [archaeon]
HVYGPEAEIGKAGEVQHTGIGKALLAAAEKEAGPRLAVTSGIGAREYYRPLGYSFESPYMVKYL